MGGRSIRTHFFQISCIATHTRTNFFALIRNVRPAAPVEDDPLSRLRAGEATSLVLLTATAQGLASCPITEPLEVVETRAAVRADVFGAEGHPQMLLRIGWAPVNADPLPSTPRRALSDYVSDLDDASDLDDTATA